jgi:hypothetical protein
VAKHEAEWLEQTGSHRWRVLRDLRYDFLGFYVIVPAGFECDLFSCVPDTNHPEMWRAAILHDHLRQQESVSRAFSDGLFLCDMVRASLAIRKRLIDSGVSEKEAEKEMVSIQRRAVLYWRGVAGWIGSVYIGLQRVKSWFS